MIDTSDINEITAKEFANARKNPYAEKLRKNGYSIIIHVSPEDIKKTTQSNVEKINNMERNDWLDLDAEEVAALKRYRQSHNV